MAFLTGAVSLSTCYFPARGAITAAPSPTETRRKLLLLQARRLAEEQALLFVRKQELIKQLRAIEAVPISEVTKYDPTTTAGQGLLEEMSLAELKERLQV
jgi:hypothetical protein